MKTKSKVLGYLTVSLHYGRDNNIDIPFLEETKSLTL